MGLPLLGIQYLRSNDFTLIEATGASVKAWTKHVHEISEGFLSKYVQVDSP